MATTNADQEWIPRELWPIQWDDELQMVRQLRTDYPDVDRRKMHDEIKRVVSWRQDTPGADDRYAPHILYMDLARVAQVLGGDGYDDLSFGLVADDYREKHGSPYGGKCPDDGEEIGASKASTKHGRPDSKHVPRSDTPGNISTVDGASSSTAALYSTSNASNDSNICTPQKATAGTPSQTIPAEDHGASGNNAAYSSSTPVPSYENVNAAAQLPLSPLDKRFIEFEAAFGKGYMQKLVGADIWPRKRVAIDDRTKTQRQGTRQTFDDVAYQQAFLDQAAVQKLRARLPVKSWDPELLEAVINYAFLHRTNGVPLHDLEQYLVLAYGERNEVAQIQRYGPFDAELILEDVEMASDTVQRDPEEYEAQLAELEEEAATVEAATEEKSHGCSDSPASTHIERSQPSNTASDVEATDVPYTGPSHDDCAENVAPTTVDGANPLDNAFDIADNAEATNGLYRASSPDASTEIVASSSTDEPLAAVDVSPIAHGAGATNGQYRSLLQGVLAGNVAQALRNDLEILDKTKRPGRKHGESLSKTAVFGLQKDLELQRLLLKRRSSYIPKVLIFSPKTIPPNAPAGKYTLRFAEVIPVRLFRKTKKGVIVTPNAGLRRKFLNPGYKPSKPEVAFIRGTVTKPFSGSWDNSYGEVRYVTDGFRPGLYRRRAEFWPHEIKNRKYNFDIGPRKRKLQDGQAEYMHAPKRRCILAGREYREVDLASVVLRLEDEKFMVTLALNIHLAHAQRKYHEQKEYEMYAKNLANLAIISDQIQDVISYINNGKPSTSRH